MGGRLGFFLNIEKLGNYLIRLDINIGDFYYIFA